MCISCQSHIVPRSCRKRANKKRKEKEISVKRTVIGSDHKSLTHLQLFALSCGDSEQCFDSLTWTVFAGIYHLVLPTSIERLGHRALTSGFSGKIVLPPPLKRSTTAPAPTWKVSRIQTRCSQMSCQSWASKRIASLFKNSFEVGWTCRWYLPTFLKSSSVNPFPLLLLLNDKGLSVLFKKHGSLGVGSLFWCTQSCMCTTSSLVIHGQNSLCGIGR